MCKYVATRKLASAATLEALSYFFPPSYFTSVSAQITCHQTVEWFVNNKLESTWQEVVEAYYSPIPEFPGGTEENRKKSRMVDVVPTEIRTKYLKNITQGIYCQTSLLDKCYKFCRPFIQDTGNFSVPASGCHFFSKMANISSSSPCKMDGLFWYSCIVRYVHTLNTALCTPFWRLLQCFSTSGTRDMKFKNNN